MSSYFLIGYFGYGNIGDDLILKAFLDHAPGNQNKYYFLSGWKASPICDSTAVPVPRWDLIRILFLLLNKNVALVAPGGEIFQDRTSLLSLVYYATYFFLARLIHKPYYCIFQGVDPIPRFRISGCIVRSIFQHACFASIRDPGPLHSQVISLRGGLPTSADIIFSTYSLFEKKKRKKTIIVTLSPTARCLTDQFVGLCMKLRKDGFKLFFLSMHPTEDDVINSRVSELSGAGTVLDMTSKSLSELARLFSAASAVITTRYHSGIISLMTHTPFFMPVSDPKSAQLLRFFGRKTTIDMKTFGQLPVNELIRRVKKDFADKSVFKHVAEMRQKSGYIFKKFSDALKGS